MCGKAEGEVPEIDQLRPLAVRPPHFAPKARSCIFLFMEGGPSHIDLFDPKPELTRNARQAACPPSFGKVFTPMGVGGNALLASKRTLPGTGRVGMWVSDWYPHIAKVVDEIALVRSCWADGVNHVGSVCQMNTGSILARPAEPGCLGHLRAGDGEPGSPRIRRDGRRRRAGRRAEELGQRLASRDVSGDAVPQGRPPILHLDPPRPVHEPQQRAKLDAHRRPRPPPRRAAHRRLAARRSDGCATSWPTGCRPRPLRPSTSTTETAETKRLYGLDDPAVPDFGSMCLRARRLVERGVRFVQLYCGSGSQWDAHRDIEGNHGQLCARSDKPVAGLITDLKRRGLLDETLVIWGGEFGRTPMSEKSDGRDHNPYGFSMFLAGGGIQGGQSPSARTDEFGLRAVEDRSTSTTCTRRCST